MGRTELTAIDADRVGLRSRSAEVLDFARSELFDRTFREGMELVEETAAYLDGDGRQDSRLLSRAAALAYAGESMKLTTRLMQIASWLLVQRAVREDDMSAVAACEPRYRLADRKIESEPSHRELPIALIEYAVRARSSTTASCTWTSGCTWAATRSSRSIRCRASWIACRRLSGAEPPITGTPLKAGLTARRRWRRWGRRR